MSNMPKNLELAPGSRYLRSDGVHRRAVPSSCSSVSAGFNFKDQRISCKPGTRSSRNSASSITKNSKRKNDKSMHGKCLRMMSNIEKEFQQELEERDGGNSDLSQLLDQVKAEKIQNDSELKIAVAAKDTALAGQQRLQWEISQLQQQVEFTNTALQDQVPWNDIQLVLDQAHADLISATTRFWSTIEAFQNRRLASYLPGSGTIQTEWPDQGGSGTLGHDIIPIDSQLNNGDVPLGTPHEIRASNGDEALV